MQKGMSSLEAVEPLTVSLSLALKGFGHESSEMGVLAKGSPVLSLFLCCEYKQSFSDSDLRACDCLAYFF